MRSNASPSLHSFQFKSEVQQETLDDVMQQLTGRIYNVPPEISAVRVQVRTRKIHDFSLLDQSSKHIVARIRCEAGTYIRTMARDMGLLLDLPVELKELRREDSGAFTLDDCVELHEIADAIWLWKECNEESVRAHASSNRETSRRIASHCRQRQCRCCTCSWSTTPTAWHCLDTG